MSNRTLSWLYCPSVHRMSTWVGETRRIWVTGLEGVDLGNAPLNDMPLPEGAVIHEQPVEGGIEFVVFASTGSRAGSGPTPTGSGSRRS